VIKIKNDIKKILVVEDEIPYLKILNRELTERGYKVIEAANGEKGLEQAKLENPDLILLDIKMPKMDGITMLKLLRKDEVCKKTKVIILTNFEPDKKILGGVVDDKPSYYFIKSDTKLNDLITKIDKLFT